MTLSSYELTKEIDYLFASHFFCNKPQMRRLLSYLVRHCEDDSEVAFDQRAIAIECLGRSDDFDPAENPVVRIEIGRLRRILNRFYEEEVSRSIRISIPLGQYRPVIEEQFIDSDRGYLPELAANDAKPECLSLLVQFDTQGEESAALYLLRHQMRIGLTIDIGKIHGVRLLVALPNEEGKVGDSIDFVMRVVVSATGNGFQVSSSILQGDAEQVLFEHSEALAVDYDHQVISRLLHHWVSDYFDPQVGQLWSLWLELRRGSDSGENIPLHAMFQYHQFQAQANKQNFEKAMFTVADAVKRHPGDRLLGFALADLYYREMIHGFDVSQEPLRDGIRHVREALRFDPGNASLHTLLASMTFFSKEYDIARMELEAIKDCDDTGYSFSFQRAVLQCLMGEWQAGIKRIALIVDQFGRFPAIYPALEYIYVLLVNDQSAIDRCREKVRQHHCESVVHQCLHFMEFSRFKSDIAMVAVDKEAFSARVRQHLGQ